MGKIALFHFFFFQNLTCVLIADSWTVTSASKFNLLQYASLTEVNEENQTDL